jgi:hypothetical protein
MATMPPEVTYELHGLKMALMKVRDDQWIRDYRPWALPEVGQEWGQTGETVEQVHGPIMLVLAFGTYHLRIRLPREALGARRHLDEWSDALDRVAPELLQWLSSRKPTDVSPFLYDFMEDFLDPDMSVADYLYQEMPPEPPKPSQPTEPAEPRPRLVPRLVPVDIEDIDIDDAPADPPPPQPKKLMTRKRKKSPVPPRSKRITRYRASLL